MQPQRIGLFWFTNDLRLSDQPALRHATKQVDHLLCVYVLDHGVSQSELYGQTGIGANKQQFLFESLDDLDSALGQHNQRLLLLQGTSFETLDTLIKQHEITHVFRSISSGYNENQIWKQLSRANQSVNFDQRESNNLFDQAQLPFALNELPATFTKFRKRIENLAYPTPINDCDAFPPTLESAISPSLKLDTSGVKSRFKGGAKSAKQHLKSYFSGDLPANYKAVRNALDGWDNSTKFSPWLAHGCVSSRYIVEQLNRYESNVVSNDSTYWIFFELLWREYFQWNARRYGPQLFLLSGTKNKTPLSSYYAERFQKWCGGNTPFPLVNACMNELAQTGFLSNRGRQIVASCLVNELQLDWRYGAAYFEKMLIDYDVASNWGNWQYLAGVGADAQDKRHFNLQKQTDIFDPDKRYINQWASETVNRTLDSVDAADWPISD